MILIKAGHRRKTNGYQDLNSDQSETDYRFEVLSKGNCGQSSCAAKHPKRTAASQALGKLRKDIRLAELQPLEWWGTWAHSWRSWQLALLSGEFRHCAVPYVTLQTHKQIGRRHGNGWLADTWSSDWMARLLSSFYTSLSHLWLRTQARAWDRYPTRRFSVLPNLQMVELHSPERGLARNC